MNNCREIENNLPLYLDNLLSGTDKQVVEEHLKSCPNCARALEQLQKTGNLVNDLKEVEPPPWFKQKIMAKVREESEKKSFVQRWFYPLRIKIPVQVFATICIAVLAVYIYRAGEEQMNAVLPPAQTPVMEVPQKQLPEQKIKTSVNKTIQKKETPQENTKAVTVETAKEIKNTIASETRSYEYASAPAAKTVEKSESERQRSKAGDYSFAGTVMKKDRALQAESAMPQSNIVLRVADINAAVAEVEKRLLKCGAKDIVKRMPEGKAVLTAELKVQNMKDVMAQLKTIGRVEEKSMPADNVSENISIIIEIIRN